MKEAKLILSAATMITSLFFFFFFTFLITISSSHPPSPLQQHRAAMKGAYWPSGQNSNFPPSAIDSTLYTHIYYAFLGPNPDTFQFEIDAPTASLLLNFTSTLRSKNPPLKTLYSIGGGGADPTLYAKIASDSSYRKIFIASSIQVARNYGFDGIDLDWESPKDPQEMNYFAYLIDDWRSALETESKKTGKPKILLTAAVYFASSYFLEGSVHRSYPADSINKNLDWINVMNYDYAGSWDTSVTGAHAALFSPPNGNNNVSTSYGLGSWIRSGVLKSKLVMGLPLYGKTWTLKDAGVNGIGAPAVDVGPSGDGGKGILYYKEIEEYIKKNKEETRVVFDVGSVSTYAVDGKTWIGYDDRRSVAGKIRYGKDLGIRGYFFWALSYDDHHSRISKIASKYWIS